MTPTVMIQDGERVTVEVTSNGKRNATVKMWRTGTDDTLLLDEVCLTREAARAELIGKLPADVQDEASRLLLAAAEDVVLRQQDGDGSQPAEAKGPIIGKPMAPCADPVDGQAVADELATVFREYLILQHKSDADALALWTLHAHAHAAFDYSPILILTSPERGSGKSRVLELLEYLVPKGWRNLSPSNAALYRTIQKLKPTLLLDEADNINFKDRGDLVTLLNGGYQKSGSWIPRCVGEGANLDVENFSVWCPKAFASIKLDRLPDTIVSRAAVIGLRRKLPSESIRPLRGRAADRDLLPIACRAARWCADHISDLAELYPESPAGLDDRAADVWSPLLAIADAIGGDWPARARKAAVKIANGSTAPESIGELLLAHIRQVFEDRAEDVVSSADMVRALNEIEGAPWAEWRGRGFTANALARQLRPHSIGPRNHRIGVGVSKGYHREQFSDAFRRYLFPEGTPNRYTATNDGAQQLTPTLEPLQPETVLRYENGPKSLQDNECSGVAVQRPSGGGAELFEDPAADPDEWAVTP